MPANMDTTVPLHASLVVSQMKYFTFVSQDPPACVHTTQQHSTVTHTLRVKMSQGEMPWILREYKKCRLPQRTKITCPDFAVKPVREYIVGDYCEYIVGGVMSVCVLWVCVTPVCVYCGSAWCLCGFCVCVKYLFCVLRACVVPCVGTVGVVPV